MEVKMLTQHSFVKTGGRYRKVQVLAVYVQRLLFPYITVITGKGQKW